MCEACYTRTGDAQVVFVYQCHESQLIFELPANLETMAIIASVIECGCELLHPAGEVYSFKVDMRHKEDKEVILFL